MMLLLIISSICLIVLAVLHVKTIRRVKKLSHDLQLLQQGVRSMCYSLNNVGQKLAITEEQLGGVDDKFATLVTQAEAHPAHSQAAKIFAVGGDVNDVMETCGISYAEALLMYELEQKKRAALNMANSKQKSKN